MRNVIDLIGDGIENPWNARAMIDIANVFGSACFFRDRKNLAQSFIDTVGGDFQIQLISCDQLTQTYCPIVSLENLDNAVDIYGFKLPSGVRAAVIAGNEKFGIAHDMQLTNLQFLSIV